MTDTTLQGSASVEAKRIKAKRLLAKQRLLNNSPSYGSLSSKNDHDTIMFQDGKTAKAPLGVGKKFSEIQNDAVFDTPASVFEETTAQFEKQAAYIALIANAYGLVGDSEINNFVADRSKALASAQQRQPEYMKQFTEQWENSNGFFEGAGVILSNPRALGRQVVTQGANAAIPLLTTAGGTAAGAAIGSAVPVVGTVIGGVAGSVTGAFAGGSVVEIGAEIDGMIQEAGYDVSNPDSLLEALENEALINDIKIKAERKGLTTAAVDALFQVVGGRFLKAAKVKGSGKVATTAAGAADVVVQSAGEGVGEAAGQFAKDGTVDIKDAVLESITSLGQSVGQTAIGASIPAVKKTADVAKAKVAEAKAKIDKIDISGKVSFADVAELETQISEAERNIVSAIAENQIIEIENNQQQEIIAEAEGLKSEIDALPFVDRSKPSTFKDQLGRTPESLSQFIKKNGGVRDDGGELSARDINSRSLVGLIAKSDRSKATAQGNFAVKNDIDSVKQRVFDAGFFPSKNDYNEISDSELYDAIADDLSGKKVFKAEDEIAINEILTSIDGAEQAFFERGIERSTSVEKIVEIIREEKNLGTFTPRQLVEIKSVAELESAKEDFIKDVQKIKENNYGLISKSLSKFGEFLSDFGLGLERALTPISTRVKNISLPLFVRLRKFEFDVKTNTIADNQAIKPFLVKLQQLDEETQIALDFALKNGRTDVVNEIAQENNMVEEIAAVNKTLDDIYKRAAEVGMDINYRADFFPRRVSDVNGLIDHFKGTEYWNVIQSAFAEKEASTGKPLNEHEKIALINNLIRGFNVEGISLSKKGIFKERSIKLVTPEINQFYETSDQALLAYISTANDAIETNRLFGKKGKDAPIKTMEADALLEDSIGSFVNDLVSKNNISSRDASILKEILSARFNQGQTGWITSAFRDLSYIDVMGSPLNAITQFGDLATSMYNSGILNTTTTLKSSVQENGAVSLEDIGIDLIAEEFRNGSMTSRGVNKVFKATGLDKVDRVGKLTLVNSTLKNAKNMAEKGDKKLISDLQTMFGDDYPSVLNDIKEGNITDDVKFYAFNTLLDMQPVAKSEMPEYYLKTKNLRIMYMLKTFTIKQLDIYRREVFSNLNTAIRQGDKKLAAKAMGNLVRLAGFWITMGASADYMKDLLRSAFGGDETEDPEDYLIDNALKAFGFSKYQANMIGKEGPVKVLQNLFLPPTKFFENLFKDFKKLNKGDLTAENSKTIRSIPVGGELYYFWFGGGSDNKSSRKSLLD